MKLPKFALNRDYLVLGGTAILATMTLVMLHNQYGKYVPTVPGLYYGSGGPATGLYTGNTAPYTSEPVLNDLYQSDVRPIAGPLGSNIQGIARQTVKPLQANWGAWSEVGRGAFRDRWTDVYDPTKTSAHVTGDDPTHRLSVA